MSKDDNAGAMFFMSITTETGCAWQPDHGDVEDGTRSRSGGESVMVEWPWLKSHAMDIMHKAQQRPALHYHCCS